VYRVSGTGRVADELRPWSLVLKMAEPMPEYAVAPVLLEA
jgi:hypothetical protein